jgi:hypothetical protein
VVPEAQLVETENGLVPAGEGWFVLLIEGEERALRA